MAERNLPYRNSSFMKMTRAFVFMGMVPVLLVSMLYFATYNNRIRTLMTGNYQEINRYFAKNVDGIFTSADTALAELYDYETDSGMSLVECLKQTDLTTYEQTMIVTDALESSMEQCRYISSERLADSKGRRFSLYYDQTKTLRQDNHFFTRSPFGRNGGYRDLYILQTSPESQMTVNTDDFVFVLVRNIMDTTQVKNAKGKVLATVYADINVNEIESLIDNMDIDTTTGSFYVVDPARQTYLYSSEKEDYHNANSLSVVMHQFTGVKGNFVSRSFVYFYQKIGDTEEYAVMKIPKKTVFGDISRNRSMIILLISFTSFLLLILYMRFSNRQTAPIVRLKEAMEKVQKGDLDVRVEAKTSDEMEYITNGFNRMVEDLQTYINRVYKEQINRKDAELNALKMQIQPHYLYNTLDVIRMTALEHQDPVTAELLESLGHQLRFVMGEQQERITLRKELDMLREYFTLMKVRYQGRIALHIHINKKDEQLLIPKMILQPVVENAVKHGMKEDVKQEVVDVNVARRGESVMIIVMDNGTGMTQEQVDEMMDLLQHSEKRKAREAGHIGIGMQNVYDRIKFSCGESYGFTISSVKGIGTSVTFVLPAEEQTEAAEVTEHAETDDTQR